MALLDSLNNMVKGIQNVAKGVQNMAKGVQPQQNQIANDMQGNCSFCSNCGAKLNSGAKFCSSCGTPVDGNAIQNSGSLSSINNSSANFSNGRKQEYVGTVFKCSNCGCTINQTTAICPECGMRVTGQTVVRSVQELSSQLMEIEKKRNEGFLGIGKKNVNSQIVTLIKTFPIPNTIDDIFEFIFLADANINVSLSKRGFGYSSTKESEVSDAWIFKMQQAYHKAEIAFPDDPVFKQIQKIYFDKMKELKIKV